MLEDWIKRNLLDVKTVSKVSNDSYEILSIDDVGNFLYIKPDAEGKVIDEDFAFILSDEEYNVIEDGLVQFILFEFGENFYYSELKADKNRYNEIIYKPTFNDFKYLGKSTEPLADIIEFSHLGIHDEYEILNGSSNPSEWCKKAKFLGHKSISAVNKNTLASVLSFQASAKKNDLKFIIGETVTVAVNYNENADVQETFEFKLYVKDELGWKNLLLINKYINIEYGGFIPKERLLLLCSGLIGVIPKESEFNYFSNDLKSAKRVLLELKKGFKSDLYYQIDILEYTSEDLFKKHLKNIDNYLCNFVDKVEPVLICDSYYLDKEQHILKPMINKIGGTVYPDSNNQHYKTISEIIGAYEEWFDDVSLLAEVILNGIKNTVVISDSCNFKYKSEWQKIPEFEVSGGSSEDLFFSELSKNFEEKIIKRIPVSQHAVYMSRLETECNLIVPNGLINYFMILWDLLRWCKDNNIMVGPGRGSVCGSLVAYLLDITQVDPIKYDLLFERFLNETRLGTQLPDIDIDFETSGRQAVKDYIKTKYGYDFSCSVATFGRMKLKTCLKDFSKVKGGFTFDEMNRLTKDIDDQIEYVWGDLIEYAVKSKPLYDFIQNNPDIVMLTKYALLQCKSQSVHPSAVIIVPKHDANGNEVNIYDYMPTKKIDGELVSEWEGVFLEKSMFLKEDILGLSQLDKLHAMLDLVEKHTKKRINLEDIPLDEDEVFKYFRKGWCEDVFQFGTMSLMNYSRQVKPTSVDDLIAMTALFRPGPIASGAHQSFADIKNGKKKPKYDFGLYEITKKTFSLLVYQEQMMFILSDLGGLSLVEADNARNYIKKKQKKEMQEMGERFVAGAINNGCPPDEAQKIWDKMNAFSSYSFNASHAAAYSLLSYWSQWFKVNYPLEFWTVSLTHSTEVDIPFRLSEMKKIGLDIEIRPPDVNYSEETFTCDPETNRIFFSLRNVKGVGDVACASLLNERKRGGKFFSMDEFIERVPTKVNKRVIENLIVAGAFDLLAELKQQSGRKELLKWLCEVKNSDLPEKYSAPDTRFNAFWISEQKRLTGFGNIDFKNLLESVVSKRLISKFVDSFEFNQIREGSEVLVVGKLIGFHFGQIKTGERLSLQIDSNNEVIQCNIWPNNLSEELKDMISKALNKIIAISGVVKKDKWKGVRVLYSNSASKMYIIQ